MYHQVIKIKLGMLLMQDLIWVQSKTVFKQSMTLNLHETIYTIADLISLPTYFVLKMLSANYIRCIFSSAF